MSYSQNNEETRIVEYFGGDIGQFLDIGAYDGKTFSNTLRLVELGWSGICIEPSPGPFKLLQDLHHANQKIQCVNAAITPVSGMVDFWDSNGDAISTTDANHKARWEKGSKVKYQQIKVPSMSAKEVLDKFGKIYDCVNIDTEGTNLLTLQAFMVAGLRFKLLCIEHDNQHPAIIAMFPGCQPIEVNAENLIIYYKG